MAKTVRCLALMTHDYYLDLQKKSSNMFIYRNIFASNCKVYYEKLNFVFMDQSITLFCKP